MTVPRPFSAALLVVSRRYLIVAPKPVPALPRRYLIVAPRPLPAAWLVVCRKDLIVVHRPLSTAPFGVQSSYLIVMARRRHAGT